MKSPATNGRGRVLSFDQVGRPVDTRIPPPLQDVGPHLRAAIERHLDMREVEVMQAAETSEAGLLKSIAAQMECDE